MRYFVKLRWLLLVPLFFMLPGCGLMTSVNALLPPVENGTAGSTYKFRIYDSAWAADGTDYVYFGIEIYYKIFTAAQSGSVISLSYSNQLASYGFKRLFKDGDLSTDSPTKPVLYFEDPYDYKGQPLPGYSYLDFDCYFDDNTGIFTVTTKDDGGTDLESFELKRAIAFPEGHASDEEYHYKGFNDFENGDGDIDSTIWDYYINFPPPVKVYLMLYAFSYGSSLDPNHMVGHIESPLEYLGQLEVLCQKYE